ncbi:hypothetical protein LX32DRAFT_205473 [Colletotrichum zoysiae]|uniref:Uncharacterized protein n=1 Tax=Colletotrichum zoysiae TaxID=1216348 RepID=A0AAD9H4V3_9PEZI|nr:hypothetical protein LX32DRAFT_205473 [Colletotrichum zoysiae]
MGIRKRSLRLKCPIPSVNIQQSQEEIRERSKKDPGCMSLPLVHCLLLASLNFSNYVPFYFVATSGVDTAEPSPAQRPILLPLPPNWNLPAHALDNSPRAPESLTTSIPSNSLGAVQSRTHQACHKGGRGGRKRSGVEAACEASRQSSTAGTGPNQGRYVTVRRGSRVRRHGGAVHIAQLLAAKAGST